MTREELIHIRVSKGVSKREMALRAHVSYSTIVRFEDGKKLRDYIEAPLVEAYKSLA